MLYIFVWVMLYGGTHIISKLISQDMHMEQWCSAIAMLLYVCLFFVWLCKTGRGYEIGLCITKKSMKVKDLHMIFLLVLPISNVICGKELEISFLNIVYMTSISITEEIFFRGFLLRYLIKRNKLYGIIVSSAIFAIFHVVNVFQYKSSIYTLLQVLCAFVVGICYSAVVAKYYSLFPCFIAHALTNITGSSVFPTSNAFDENMMGLWVCIAIYAGYGIILCRKMR